MISVLLNPHYFLLDKVLVIREEELLMQDSSLDVKGKYTLMAFTGKCKVFEIDAENFDLLEKAFIKEFKKRNILHQELTWSHYYMPFSDWLNELRNAPFSEYKRYNKSEITKKALNAILNTKNEDIAKELNVLRLSQIIKTNSSYLSRIFKNNTSVFLNNAMNLEKLKRAYYLSVKGKSAKITSGILGFNRSDYFRSLFRKNFGTSYEVFFAKSFKPNESKNKVKNKMPGYLVQTAR